MKYVFVVPIWIAIKINLIKVNNIEEASRLVDQGRALIISNHPSLLETIVLPVLFRSYPWTNSPKLPWSVADRNLFPSGWKKIFRLIHVSRKKSPESTKINIQATRHLLRVFDNGGNVITYPEGGRTCKGTEYTCSEGRRLRAIQVDLIVLAVKKGATVIPVWVEHGDSAKPKGFIKSYLKLFLGESMVITFGQPLTGEVTIESVAKAIMSTGR